MSEPEYNLFDEAKVLADDRPSEEGNLLEWALDAEHMIRRLVKAFNSTPQAEPVQPGRNHYEDGDVFERIAASKKQPAQQEPVAGLLVGQDSDGRYVSIAAKAHADTLPLGEYKLYTKDQL